MQLSFFNPTQRDKSIDILRFIALLCIIFAHCSPPALLSQIRSFDVPLMVFLSAICFDIKPYTEFNIYNYYSYIKKRFIRLIIPTWIFITVYSCLQNIILHNITIKTLILRYSLLGGMGYIWIIRVFFICAILAPILYLLIKIKLKNFIYLITILFIINNFIIYLFKENFGGFSSIFTITEMTLGYAIVSILGYKICHLNKNQIIKFSLFFITSFIFIMLYKYNKIGHIIYTQTDKYPPGFYYLSYAMGIIFILYYLKEKIVYILSKLNIENICLYIGSRTLWIYFWHIPLLDIFGKINCYYLKYIIIVILSIIGMIIQEKIIIKISSQIQNKKFNKILKTIFIG